MIFVLILLGAAILALVYYVRSSSRGGPLSITSRMGRYGLLPEDEDPSSAVSDIVAPARRQPGAVSQSVERLVGRGPVAQSVYTRLDRAQIKMTPAEFITLAFACFVGAMAVGLFVKGVI